LTPTGVTVALFASNCKKAGAADRYKYMEELMKHIKVHSFLPFLPFVGCYGPLVIELFQ
jgi:hypothetical protein